MTAEEAIKYLQQLYPNGGHCWLDDQRIEAISMAIKALQKESASEDFKIALEKKVREAQDWTYIEEEGGECPLNEEFGADDLEEFAMWAAEWVRKNEKELVSEDLEEAAQEYTEKGSKCQEELDSFKAGANWQKQQMMKEAVSGHVGQTINGMLRALSDETFGDMGFTAGDKVKLIIIKAD